MRVAIFSTHVLWPSHYETELEIMQKHLDINDEVHHFTCQKKLSICDLITDYGFFKENDLFLGRDDVCSRCVSIREKGENLIKGNYIKKNIIDVDDYKKSQQKIFFSINDLKEYKIGNYEIGESILSSLISFSRDPYPRVENYKKIISEYINSCTQLYFFVLNLLEKISYDAVYVFNGRFAHVRAIMCACQAKNVVCLVHERGSDIYHYELFRNSTPHNLTYRLKEIKRYWEIEPDELKKTEIGSLFYIERLNGIEQSWFSFVKDQVYGCLPENWDQKKRNIVIFNSSEDEFESIGQEWKNPLYDNQLDGLCKIINDPRIKNDQSIRIFLRLHPNLKKTVSEYYLKLCNLKSEQLTIIYPESEVSTYSLIKLCEKVLTFGSTVGIEAVYWEKPSILAGICFYRFLGGTYNPNSHDELIGFILENIEPKSKLAALMYGYYLKKYGILFKYFQPESIQSGKFKGVNIMTEKRSLYKRGINKLFKLPKRITVLLSKWWT